MCLKNSYRIKTGYSDNDYLFIYKYKSMRFWLLGFSRYFLFVMQKGRSLSVQLLRTVNAHNTFCQLWSMETIWSICWTCDSCSGAMPLPATAQFRAHGFSFNPKHCVTQCEVYPVSSCERSLTWQIGRLCWDLHWLCWHFQTTVSNEHDCRKQSQTVCKK